MIPAYRSPFKLDAVDMETSARDRLEMLAAAVAGDSRITIDECEIMREGVSYTVDTLEDIIQRYLPTGKLTLIIGDDLAEDFPKWRDSEKILKMADIAIGRRNKSAVTNLPYPHIFLDNEIMNISSEMVKQLIKEERETSRSKPWRALVPKGVRAVIEDKKLYGFQRISPVPSPQSPVPIKNAMDCTQANILLIEKAVRASVSLGRYLHSKNTAILAHDLCIRFGLDPLAGYLAGIAHDIGKELTNRQMVKLAKMDKMKITEIEVKKPSLLHGRAGAILLKKRFHIYNKDVLEAVATHTYGRENMGPLAKVIYIADKAESSRNIDSELRRLCTTCPADTEVTLDTILYAILHKTVRGLQSRKLVLSEDTLRLLDRMKEQGEGR